MTRSILPQVSRRGGLLAGLAALASTAIGRANAQTPVAGAGAGPQPVSVSPFSPLGLRQFAQRLAQQPPRPLPPLVASAEAISYDDQREVRSRADHALWAEQADPKFRAQFFPAMYRSARPVQIFEVHGGEVRPIVFSPDLFSYPDSLKSAVSQIAGLSGFRLQWPLNGGQDLDEIGAFQGASYFRGLGPHQQYGISARGLSIHTGDGNEEFPNFTVWWLERPAPGATRVVLHALLESESCTGAYTFQIIPGSPNIYDVEAELYPRRAIDAVGVAPMSSMFLFGTAGGLEADDFRTAVHDSDGLLIRTGDGASVWRPLNNPKQLQVSRFAVTQRLTGFGLIQRARTFEDFGDLEARYDRRPSLWVEPFDDWGPGGVFLVEIPTRSETDDNIAAFWRPERPWPAGAPVSLRYRLNWGDGPAPTSAAQVVRTRSGSDWRPGERVFAIDFADVGDLTGVTAEVKSDVGVIDWSSVQPYVTPGSARLSFGLKPGSATVAELTARLLRNGAPVSETWLSRWIA